MCLVLVCLFFFTEGEITFLFLIKGFEIPFLSLLKNTILHLKSIGFITCLAKNVSLNLYFLELDALTVVLVLNIGSYSYSEFGHLLLDV